MNHDFVIGLLGGMGTYATLHIFRRYAEIFPAEKEWERPRLVIDNRCTMPSRVRAYLDGVRKDQLVREMTDSLRHLLEIGCSRILLGCNTAHLFLPAIFERLPALQGKIIHLVDTCVAALVAKDVSEVFLLGTEGTIESRVYQNACSVQGIRCSAPTPTDYPVIRDCIEAVKQNRFSPAIFDSLLSLLHGKATCILGCTEFPVLLDHLRSELAASHIGRVFDPVDLALFRIRGEFLALPQKDKGFS